MLGSRWLAAEEKRKGRRKGKEGRGGRGRGEEGEEREQLLAKPFKNCLRTTFPGIPCVVAQRAEVGMSELTPSEPELT